MSPFNARFLSIFAFCLWLSKAERDFNFNDQLQIALIEPQEEPKKHLISHKSPYLKEISKCPATESKMILSLVLKDNEWKDIIEKKKSRAINKLSKFFAVPKEYIQLDSVSTYDLYDMDKKSIRRGPNRCNMNRRLGKLEFMIGCGNSLFIMGEPISNQIGAQMLDGSIDDISGLNFGMWMIWRKKVTNRVQRHRRQAEGSGEDDYEYDYENSEDDDVEESVTDLPAVTTHPHRHHHGGSKIDLTDNSSNNNNNNNNNKNNRVLIDTNTIDTNNNNNNIKHKKNEVKPLPPQSKSSIDDHDMKTYDENIDDDDDDDDDDDNDNDFVESIDKIDNNDNQDANAEEDEDIVSSVSKLESVITKTIKNTEIESLTPIVDGFDPDDEIETSSAVLEPIEKVEKNFGITEKSPIVVVTSTPMSVLTTAEQITPSSGITTTVGSVVTTMPTTTPAMKESSTDIVVEIPTTTPPSTSTTSTITTTSTTPITTTSMKTFDRTTPIITTTTTTTIPTTITTSTKDEDNKNESTTIVVPNVEVKENAKELEMELTSEEPTSTIVNTTPVSSTYSTTSTSTTTTPKPTTTTTPIPTTEYIEPEPVNKPPMIKTRLPKQPVTAGKPFSLTVPLETFYDNEDGTNLRLQLFDKNNQDLKPSSWIQFNTDTREIYGLPLEDAVSRWQYLLAATDSGNETTVETVDISVQQHKGHRSVNHEISIGVKLNEKFVRNIDWQIRLIRGIAETLNDNSLSNVVVREVRQNQQDPQLATFVYTNESLPKDHCPEEKLDELVKLLDPKKLTESLLPELSVKSVTAQPIGPCQKISPPKSRPTPHATKNFPPVPRNQVDRVNATAGHLLVYKVPADTFYDPEDTTDLKLSLLTIDQKEISPRHWLQFDSKNQEFFGIPKSSDHGSEEYLLIATDNGGLTASDALVVVVNHAPKRDFSVLFKVFLDIPHENFSPQMQRKFVERVAQLFGDNSPQFIQILKVTTDHDSDGMIVHFYNTTLFKSHNRCPEEEIEAARNVYFHQDSILRDRVKKTIGNEFRVTSVQIVPMGSCHSLTHITHHDYIPSKPDDNHTNKSSTTDKDDYLLTFILPAVIILFMILLATVIACVLHRRRMTGKMELGDEEERKSFRSKGIPVIFQDELDEKPEIGNKSPVILQNEKPPLLPPSYNSTNLDEDNDVDEYVPPPAVVMGGREARGKSPVTPSYRKPPPYVSP